MNIIQVVCDTLRRDYLSCYGNTWIHTENIEKLADKSIIFDNAYIASYPTLPHRKDIFTGRYTFTFGGWGPLPRNDIIESQLLRQAGYTTMLIADTYHLIRDGSYYDRGFDGWWWIRGQEGDRYMTNAVNNQKSQQKIYGRQYPKNVSLRRFESDYFVAQTMTSAERWLELNYDQHDKWFLHIDTFDPHEPWDPPKWYTEMYDREYDGPEIPVTAGFSKTANMSEEALNHAKALYAGEVTLVDRWFGNLLEKIEDLGLLENTAIIFTSDHGTFLGEHGFIHKYGLLYEEIAHIPLIIRLPETCSSPHGRYNGFVQPPDLMPTILELADITIPPTIQGESIIPMITEKTSNQREIAVSSASLQTAAMSPWITVTSTEWTLIAANPKAPPIDLWTRKKVESELYHLPSDPSQTRNLINEKPQVAKELHSKLIKFLKSMQTSEEILKNLTK